MIVYCRVYVFLMWCRNLDVLASLEEKRYPITLLPLVAGIHEIKGCTVVDMRTGQEYAQPTLAHIFVEP